MSSKKPGKSSMSKTGSDRWVLPLILLWGILLALWLARVYFEFPPDRVHANHEGYSYAVRLLEFRDLLGAGYLSPQWAGHFRRGLGSPYFSYYQPGVFYVASLVPWSLAPNHAWGLTVIGFSLAGYLGMFTLLRRRFGLLSGILGASLLSLSVYAATEVYVRGDLSEFASMMLVAVALSALDGWLQFGRLCHLALLAITGAAITITHAAVGMIAHGLFGVLLLGLIASARVRRRGVGALVALGAGVGMAAFYWFPVFFEWQLVTPDKAFQDFYHYSRHFVSPRQLVGSYTRTTIIPFTLGWLVPGLLVINTVSILLLRRGSAPQRTVVWVGLACFLGSVFMMTAASEFVWAAIWPLQRVQFPWRVLTLVTILAAALAGAMPAWRSERWRAVFVALLIAWATLDSRAYTAHERHKTLRVPPDARSLSSRYIAPDLRNEWLPRGASLDAVHQVKQLPAGGPGATVSDYSFGSGYVQAQVRATSATFVRLPHYYFPVGWVATMNGQRLNLGADDYGLMRVELAAETQGRLDVRFSMTPMRRVGLAVSAATLLLGGLTLVTLVKRNRGRET